jgi:hypothetical protein
MPVLHNEKIIIGSCDNGFVDGSFFSSITNILTVKDYPYILNGNIRSDGPLIHKNRESVIRYWLSSTDVDWLLFIDSDIVFTPDDVNFLCQSADSKNKKIVSGLYFTIQKIEPCFPYPVVFIRTEKGEYLALSEIEENSVSMIDAAGLGFVLIHRSVVEKMLKRYSLSEIFVSTIFGEDISFFDKVHEIGEDVYLDTRASVKHMKRYPIDLDFHKMYESYNLEKMKDN